MSSTASTARPVLLTGGTVVTAESTVRADILLDGGRIAAVGADLSAQLQPGVLECAEHVDVTGKLLLPGGVDAHTHLEYGIDGFTTRTVDDFATGTTAAALGGTTTVIDFVKKEPDHTVRESFERRVAAIEARAVLNVGLHVIIPPQEQQIDALDDARALREHGVTSWKFFMAYPGTQMVDDGLLLRGMDAARELGVLPMVHAENGHMVARDTAQLLDAGTTGEPFHHAAHTHAAEAEAVHRAIVLAQSAGTPLFVVHVSSAQAAEEIGRARLAGARVWAETCPQYLLTAYEEYAHLGQDAAAYICSPPIRERANQAGLWTALATGTLATIGTDHAGFCMEDHDGQDVPPQKRRSPGHFPSVPNGVPGVYERLMVMYDAGVNTGRLDVTRFVDLVATRPAKLFGLYPRKGAIAVGADADVVVWDPDRERVIHHADTPLRSDYSLYEGRTVRGCPTAVYAGGELVVTGTTFHGAPGRGAYLPRETPDVAPATRLSSRTLQETA
ncbi:dihydropyrimidinase [Georgenia sp. 10Sc9-8]|uniref:Dihydropyrimidinase n=1 Tax=Georgenia halotolerans TaxID=3028317 RepID=A0ABT5TWX4_9MICO|nr:dihydropyrimidinase [Georgenia halotolerans]